MKRILLTGAAGFIGFHLVKSLISKDYEILGIDNINSYYDVELKYDRLENLGIKKEDVDDEIELTSSQYSNFKFIKLNIADAQTLEGVFSKFKPDIVINLAAQAGVRYSIDHPRKYIESNINGFFNILESVRNNKVKTLLFASSSSVYGDSEVYPVKEDFDTSKPLSLYAASKKSNEVMAYVYSNMFDIKTIGLRFFTVYGPWGRPDMALYSFTKKIIDGEEIKVFNKGEMYRDFTYVDDIVNGIVTIVEKSSEVQEKYKIYNIGRGIPIKLLDFIKQIEISLGKKAKMKFESLQPGDVLKTFADTTALQKDYGYKPIMELKEGVSNFVEWFKDYYQV